MNRLLALALAGTFTLLAGQPPLPGWSLADAAMTYCGGTLTHGQKDPAQSFDPANPGGTLTAQEIFRHIYDGLLIFDEKLEPHPNLAQSWKVSADGREWTFKLRPGVKFQDGSPFDAFAAKFHFERILSQQSSSIKSLFTNVTEIAVPDQYTIVFRTRAPFGPLLNYLAHGGAGIVSKTAVGKWGQDFPVHPVGTGPYRLQDYAAGERVVLARNDGFWGGRPCFDRIVFRVIPEDGARAAALETGELDTMVPVPVNSVARLRQQKNLVIDSRPVITMMYIGFNLSKEPFTDLRVRQALSMAIDRKGIVDKILDGFATVADSPMAKGTFGYSPSPTYQYDPAKAKALLAEAGWTAGPGGVLQKNGRPLKFVLWTPQDLYLKDVAVAQAAQAEMRAVGADVDLRTVEAANWFTTLKVPAGQAPYDMFMWSLTPTTGDGYQQLNELSRSDPDTSKPPLAWNLTHYVNPKVDELINAAASTVDQNKRKAALKEAQRIIMADAPLVFLYSLNFVVGYKSNLTGVRLLPNRFVDFRETKRIR